MDLIYANSLKEDIGVMKDYTFDLAFGEDENDFECKINSNAHCCKNGYFLYIEDTEYGGIIDNISVNTSAEEVTYSGRTWHGILNSKILQPDNGADYLILSGEANTVIQTLIDRMGLNRLFKADTAQSGITVNSYKMSRYISGYDGIIKMLKNCGAKLKLNFKNGYVILKAEKIIDYSNDEQFNSDLISFDITKRYSPVNHCICLGKGDLSAREVLHLYADKNGNICENQVFTGIEEVTAVYENVNATGDELKSGGIEVIKNSWAADTLNFDFTADDESYDIGDIVGAREEITAVTTKREITKKIVTIKNNDITISYPTDSAGGGNSRISTNGGGVDFSKIYPVGSIYITANDTNPTDLFGGVWEQIKDRFLLSAGTTYAAGSKGGEATHKLTVNEIPAHKHNVYYKYDNNSADNITAQSWAYVVSNTVNAEKDNGAGMYNTGGSQSHNNMPPYLAVYVWKRTA
jgi:hypothetical protein